jgi:hypothetical protein
LEAEAVNRMPLYIATAVTIGVTVMLLPLLIFTTTTSPNGQGYFDAQNSLSEDIRGFDDSSLIKTEEYPISGLEMFTISLAAASVAYLLFKHRIGH